MTVQITTFYSTAISGTNLAYAAVDATGNTFANDGEVLAIIKNSSGANTYTVTIDTPGKIKGETITAESVTISPSSVGDLIGPFPPEIYNSTAGLVTFSDYAGAPGDADATDLSIALIRIP